MTTDELIAYYVALLIIQYATQPNALATIAAFCGLLIQNQIYATVGNGFNFTVLPIGQQPDGAVGVQLEEIAAYRGAQRVIYGIVPATLFDFVDAQNISVGNGFMDAEDPPSDVTWIFLTAEGTNQPLYSLTDDQLYRLTQLRAQVQSCDMSLESIDTILETFFGNNVALVDNENMTIFYIDLNSDTDTLFGIAAITHSLPAPAGVAVQTFRADMLTDFFGYQDAEEALDPSFVGFSDAETTLTTGTFLSAP